MKGTTNKPRWTTVEYVKLHSHLTYNDEDEAIEQMIASAEQTILNTIDRTYEELIELYGDIPAPIRESTVVMVDDSYTHRGSTEPTQLHVVQYNLDMKLKPYMKL